MGCNLVDAGFLLVGTVLAKSAVFFLVVSPCHVVLAPMPDTSIDLFLVS